MGKHCSKRGTFAGVLTLKWRTQEIPGMHGPSALRSRRLMCCHGHIVSGMAKEGGGSGCAGEPSQPWTASRFPLLEEARVLLTLVSSSQTIRHARYFPKTAPEVRGKG